LIYAGATVAAGPKYTRQDFAVVSVSRRVGGSIWIAICPESGKAVRHLYVKDGKCEFQSRHALKLRYRSQAWDGFDRQMAHMQTVMDRIGAIHPDLLPPRPKHMPKKLFVRRCWELWKADIQLRCSAVGKPLPDIFTDPELEETIMNTWARSFGIDLGT
jgi:hypothetical protein